MESGDVFENIPHNATYRSKTTQNELISYCDEEINGKIIKGIKDCGFYSILAHEVTDCSNMDQRPLVLSSVDKEGNICERLIKFIHWNNGITGEALKDKRVKCIATELNLDIQDFQYKVSEHDNESKHHMILSVIPRY